MTRFFCGSAALCRPIERTLFLVLAVGLCPGAGCTDSRPAQSQSELESLFERVNRTGVIRCAYVVYPPSMIKDPDSGELSGVSVDVMNKVAEDLGVSLEWTEEVGWSTMIEGLQTGRYDLVVSGIWPNASRARRVDFSVPLFYSGIGVYVRAGEHQLAPDLSNLNEPSVRIATIDGEMSDIIATSQFSKAKRVSLPQLADVSQLLLNVVQQHADVTFVEPAIAYAFEQNNPDTLRNLRPQEPIRVFGNTVMFRAGEYAFARMLNIAIDVLINSGDVERIIARYEPVAGAFYRTAHPYRHVPQQHRLEAAAGE